MVKVTKNQDTITIAKFSYNVVGRRIWKYDAFSCDFHQNP